MTHDESKYPRRSHAHLIKFKIPEPDKNRSETKEICLFSHIDDNCEKRYEKQCPNENILSNIEYGVRRLREHQSSINRKQYGENEHEIYEYTHNKDWKTERQQSTGSTEQIIPDKQHREQYIHPKSYQSSKCHLIQRTKWSKIVHTEYKSKERQKKRNIKYCYTKGHGKGVYEIHDEMRNCLSEQIVQKWQIKSRKISFTMQKYTQWREHQQRRRASEYQQDAKSWRLPSELEVFLPYRVR